ncbi:1-deoxy-D-xylulose 5-phosphate reductoisomerase [Fervidicella metallireducens AeB]|uniref:1-deoxy-D-xylulose 5-phosphate reductoisomerase n=1 Tax=Fervidicella metallireducens AeB TaxID=1403537 RepID=A0A017RXB7_9CLOT|nr:1-deoxy-D-xylulose-5-phosphate reductoisomerase [Fervidicella metallireducens]EYE89342.1 1-deoxy-D-xylulose 5-phosphate reductoisomerase [Fervidicella metallireducens AeB]
MKKITILGSTGSIGTQSLEIIRNRKEDFKVIALTANSNVKLLLEQIKEFKPQYAVVMSDESYKILKNKVDQNETKILKGLEGLIYVSSLDDVEIVLTSVVGMIGLKPTIAAIQAGKDIALANKETLVVGGQIISNELKKSNSKIIPVDSEHCALFQCLQGQNKKDVKRLILTASGGPFRGKKKEELKTVTPEMALRHPNWSMGKKISIDSATLMNKALEVIEAHWLFDVTYDKIDVVLHPQSIIHSMVEYCDGSILAQLSETNMQHPIQYALDYPRRNIANFGYLDLIKNNTLTFEEPDINTFECLSLGFEAGKIGGTMPTVLNAANEEAVNLFLGKKISFLEISEIVKEAMNHHVTSYDLTLDKILEVELLTRNYVNSLVK